MSITTSTRKMTAQESMAFDLGQRTERIRIKEVVSSLEISEKEIYSQSEDGKYAYTDYEKLGYNKALADILREIL